MKTSPAKKSIVLGFGLMAILSACEFEPAGSSGEYAVHAKNSGSIPISGNFNKSDLMQAVEECLVTGDSEKGLLSLGQKFLEQSEGQLPIKTVAGIPDFNDPTLANGIGYDGDINKDFRFYSEDGFWFADRSRACDDSDGWCDLILNIQPENLAGAGNLDIVLGGFGLDCSKCHDFHPVMPITTVWYESVVTDQIVTGVFLNVPDQLATEGSAVKLVDGISGSSSLTVDFLGYTNCLKTEIEAKAL